jgi:uncharacterized phage protein (TIGR02216 family)
VIATGLGLLRLPPAQFWAMTPREFALASRIGAPGLKPARRDLDALMRAYPDEIERK